MFKVHINNLGHNWYLRGTTWTCDIMRADKFDNREDAQSALLKAKKFMVVKMYKAARVVEMV